MAQQETYGNWLGPKRLVRQPGIYSVAGKMSPVGDFRPASPDSFEDDYDDVSMGGSERGAPATGVYLLAGPPGSSPAPSLKDPQELDPKSREFDPKSPDWNPKCPDLNGPCRDSNRPCRDSNPRSRCSAPLAALSVSVALSALAWAALLAAGIGKHRELRAELEALKSNLSGIWDSAQQDQTRLQFGIHQHQLELQELSELLCRTLGGSRRCPAGWRAHGSSCYSFSRDSLGWAGARNACGDLGAHLVVVSSEEEQVFLLQNSNRSRSFWLGVTDPERDGRWRWVTGEEPGLSFWDVWAPQPRLERRDCGALGPHGRWESENCARALGWICERAGGC